jgi:hypothetical protein
VPLVQVRHLAGEELDVRTANSHSVNVDNGLTWFGDRCGNLLNRTGMGCGDHVRLHGLPDWLG